MSRSLNNLNKELSSAYQEAFNKYAFAYPNEPQPFITCTYRSNEEQNELYKQGRDIKGKIVTYAKGGESPHNFEVSFAFDIAFIKNNKLDWSNGLFKKFADIIKQVSTNVEWGGDWRFKDYPHFELKNWKK